MQNHRCCHSQTSEVPMQRCSFSVRRVVHPRKHSAARSQNLWTISLTLTTWVLVSPSRRRRRRRRWSLLP
ncbi:MAG: hypothetical protein AAF399_23335, partial [Bacteroidota bacterium]